MPAKVSSPPAPADVAFARLNDVCMVLPGTECKLSHGSPSYFVGGKMFLSFVDDHQTVALRLPATAPTFVGGSGNA